MSGDPGDVVAELRALAETVLDRLDPILQKVAAGSAGPAEHTDGDAPACSSCSWCPLCALAAVIRGERHDLVTLVAGQAGTVLAALREALDAHERAAATASAAPSEKPATAPAEKSAPASAFVPIVVTVKD